MTSVFFAYCILKRDTVVKAHSRIHSWGQYLEIRITDKNIRFQGLAFGFFINSRLVPYHVLSSVWGFIS